MHTLEEIRAPLPHEDEHLRYIAMGVSSRGDEVRVNPAFLFGRIS